MSQPLQTPVATQFPLSDINPDVKTANYIAVLERKVGYQETLLLQYRALLEAMTGDKYDEIDTRLSADGIKTTAANATARRIARSLKEAEALVEENITAANEG